MSSAGGRGCSTARGFETSLWSITAARATDYLELTKPRIAAFGLFTVAVGYTLGSRGEWRLIPLMHALFGIGLVAAGSSALNQYVERRRDARMQRTARRPLPAGRLLPVEAWLFGISCSITGTVWLAVQVSLLTAVLSVRLCLHAAQKLLAVVHDRGRCSRSIAARTGMGGIRLICDRHRRAVPVRHPVPVAVPALYGHRLAVP